ncbi:MAG: peroxidase family protein, partial [Bacteroidota bacterium]
MMFRQTLLLLFVLSLPFTTSAQLHRTIDGTSNNLQSPEWGSAHAPLHNLTSIAFGDGYSTPAGANRTNARVISNSIFSQSELANDPLNLSDFIWVFGQFIDHELIAVGSNPSENISIPVNFPDAHFNPNGIFQNIAIHMSRSQIIDGSGTDASNPRRYSNEITSWIDGSAVYGSDDERASWLRSFVGGRLRVSSGDFLPYNTISGEVDGTIDSDAPFMDNENPFVDVLFVAGDARANEQPLLAAMHTIFVREHNRLCEELAIKHPTWSDEELYQHARHFVSGFIQSIVYNEWLPAMGVHLPSYPGYDATIFPNISNVFSAAAFRLGHTLINSNVLITDNDGNPVGSLTLKDAFFNPAIITDFGLDPFFKGMAVQTQQDLDGKVVDDVRNFLFGPPQFGLGGLDLAAININRGRERGLADFNTIRTNLGLSAYTSFSEVNPDPAIFGTLQSLYTDINDIDPWVGMLVEKHMSEALFGETIMEIMIQQFGALRDGDRFYFEIDPVLSPEEIAEIRETTFRDIIMRNTEITLMQSDVFGAMPHDSICPTAIDWVDLTGNLQTESGINMSEVSLQLSDETDGLLDLEMSDTEGNFIFTELVTCKDYVVRPFYNEDIRNGVNTNDMVKMAKHILNTEVLDSPYKIIAADVNNNGSVNVADLLHLQKVILFIDSSFVNTPPWRFISKDYVFENSLDPFNENFAEQAEIYYLSEQNTQHDFVVVKIGDLNSDAN